MLAPERRLTDAELARALHWASGRVREAERRADLACRHNAEWQALGYLWQQAMDRMDRRLMWWRWIAIGAATLATVLALLLAAVWPL